MSLPLSLNLFPVMSSAVLSIKAKRPKKIYKKVKIVHKDDKLPFSCESETTFLTFDNMSC